MGKDHNEYEKEARRIIDRSDYMSVGTSTKSGKPWVAPVLFVHDHAFNLYFLSAVDALHSKNILENDSVSISIFDSHQKIGLSEGIQAEGRAELVEEDSIKKAIELYCKKAFPDSDIKPTGRYVPENYLGASEFRFFRIRPANIYITGEDRRIRVAFSDK